MVRSIASASGALAAVGLTVLLSYRLSLLGGLLVCWQVWGMMSRSLTRRVTLTSFDELNSWWSQGGPHSLSHAVGGVSERILIIFLVSSHKNREAIPDFGLDNLLIEEDFTV